MSSDAMPLSLSRPDEARAATAAPPPDAAASPRGWFARLQHAIDRFRTARLVIVGYGFFSPSGGAWKSIHHYYVQMTVRGANVMLLARPARRTLRRMALALVFSPRVVINGLDAFCHADALLFIWLRRDVMLYLHETRFVMDDFQRRHPVRFRLVRHFLKRRRIACVSRQQQQFLREEFGVTRSHVVYENIAQRADDQLDETAINIVMVGTIEPRKGATLFSRVADLAHESGRPWRFYWIGPPGHTADLYLSPRVAWLGPRSNVEPYLRRASLFFLSSSDDPFPLAALEALSLFCRCVVYRDVGLAEILDRVSGCGVYADYTPEAAFAVIERALALPLDHEAVRAINRDISSVEAFADRIDSMLQEHDRELARATVVSWRQESPAAPGTPPRSGDAEPSD